MAYKHWGDILNDVFDAPTNTLKINLSGSGITITSASIEVNLDYNTDSIRVYGSGSGGYSPLFIKNDGVNNAQVVMQNSQPLPIGAFTDATGSLIYTELQTINTTISGGFAENITYLNDSIKIYGSGSGGFTPIRLEPRGQTTSLNTTIIDSSGNVVSAFGGADIDHASFTTGSSQGTVIMGVVTSSSIDQGDKGALAMTKNRELLVTNPLSSFLIPTHISPIHGTVTYATTSTLTCSGWPFTVDTTVCNIRYIVVTTSGSLAQNYYENGKNGISISASSNTLTLLKESIAYPVFASTDVKYEVGITYLSLGSDTGTDSNKTSEISPIWTRNVLVDLVDTTNINSGSNYYPDSTGDSLYGYSNLSLTGKLIDADGIMNLSVEATNDEDTTLGDWISIYGYDTKNNAITNMLTVSASTMTFAWDFDSINYSTYRILVSGSTASNTAIIKGRKSF